MKSSDVETWAARVIESVRAGHPVEDARVELKSAWPVDHWRTARRLAGHANAARGATILWLFGVNEGDASVPGVLAEEMSNWWSQVTSFFGDQVYPAMQDVIVRDGDVSVVALGFETHDAPYVVKAGQAGAVQFEVPWREATSIRSSRRSELRRMLVDAATLPPVEVFWAAGDATILKERPDHAALDIRLSLYFDAIPGEWLVFPRHRRTMVVSCDPPEWTGLEASHVGLHPTDKRSNATEMADNLTLTGPAKVRLDAHWAMPLPASEPSGNLRVVAELWPSLSDIPVRLDRSIPFRGERPGDGLLRRWFWSTTEDA